MRILLVEENLGLGSGRLLGTHDHVRVVLHLLPDVVVQQLAVGGDGQLSLDTIVVVGAVRAAPVCVYSGHPRKKVEKKAEREYLSKRPKTK